MNTKTCLFIAAAAVMFSGCATSESSVAALPARTARQIEAIASSGAEGNGTSFLVRNIHVLNKREEGLTSPESTLVVVIISSRDRAEADCRCVIDNFRRSILPEDYAALTVVAGDGTGVRAEASTQAISSGSSDSVIGSSAHYDEDVSYSFTIAREDLLAGREPTQTVRNGKRVEI